MTDLFFSQRAALGLTCEQLGKQLGCTAALVSYYGNGKRAVPPDIQTKMHELLAQRALHIRDMTGQYYGPDQILAQGVIFHNQVEKPNLTHGIVHTRVGNVLAHTQERSTYHLPYRMSPAKFRVYLESIAALAQRLRAAKQLHPDHEQILSAESTVRSLATDAKAIAKGGAPYDVRITAAEWRVASAALRRFDTKESRSLYTHWRKHRWSGWPAHRST